jgi:tetratricopeptide (TPR) repeat protein
MISRVGSGVILGLSLIGIGCSKYTPEPRQLLDQAEQTAATIKEPYLKSLAYHEIAKIRAHHHDTEGARRILGLIPNTYEQSIAYSVVATVLARAGDSEGARRMVMLGLKATGEGEQDFKSGSAYGHLIVALAEAGDCDGALERLQEVPGGPTGQDIAISEVAFVLARKGRLPRALQLLEEKDDGTYVQGIQDMVKEADPALALPLVKKIGDAQRRGQALQIIAKEQVSRGNTDIGIATARSIEDPWYKASTLVWLADDLRSEHPELTEGLLSQAWTSANAIESAPQKFWTLTGLARSWAKGGKRESAMRYAELAEKALREIPEEWERRAALGEEAAAFARGGNLVMALQIASSDPKADREGILRDVAKVQVELGDLNGALKTIEPSKNHFHLSQILLDISKREPKPEEARKRRAEAAAAMESVDSRSKSLNDIRQGGNEMQQHVWNIMEVLAKAGEFKASVKMAVRFRQDLGLWTGSFAFRRAAELQAEAGKLEDALAWIRNLEEGLPRSLALAGAAEGALKRSDR